MKAHRLVRAFSLGLVLSIVPISSLHSANAAVSKLSSSFSDSTATLDVTVSADYRVVKEKLSENMGKAFESIPFVANVTSLAAELPTKPGEVPQAKSIKGDRLLVFKFSGTRKLDDTIFPLQEDQAICSDLSLGEDKCPHYLTLTLNAPIHSYRIAYDSQEAALPAGSFKVTIDARPVNRAEGSAGTNVKMELTLMNRNYMSFLRRLHEQGKLKRMPVENEIKGAFLIWAQSVIHEQFK